MTQMTDSSQIDMSLNGGFQGLSISQTQFGYLNQDEPYLEDYKSQSGFQSQSSEMSYYGNK